MRLYEARGQFELDICLPFDLCIFLAVRLGTPPLRFGVVSILVIVLDGAEIWVAVLLAVSSVFRVALLRL